MRPFNELSPEEQIDYLVAHGRAEDVCGDGSFLILKPDTYRSHRWGRYLQWASVVLSSKPRGLIDEHPPWSHKVLKCRQGSQFWDDLEDFGYSSGFHHVKIDDMFEDRVFLHDRSLRALKVLMQ